MMMVLRIKKQFAVRRRDGIGPRPIGQEAGDLIVEFLPIGHGPEQIAVRSSQHPRSVGHTVIYTWRHQNRQHGGWLFKHPRHRGKRRSSNSVRDWRGLIPFVPNRVSISQRPQGANQRNRIGAWEVDPAVSRISKVAVGWG